jgi:hypothetical protein
MERSSTLSVIMQSAMLSSDVQYISVFVAEFKWCGFWAAVFVFVVEVLGRSWANQGY